MPRRAEHSRAYCEEVTAAELSSRVGVRKVTGGDRMGMARYLLFDPSVFACRVLAGELADEWVDYVTDEQTGLDEARVKRRVIADFCRAVDKELGGAAGAASLAKAQPDLAGVFAAWERALPASYRAGSTVPGRLACQLRVLLRRRTGHPDRPMAGGLARLVQGQIGVGWGTTNETEEFSRADKRAIVTAAWRGLTEMEKRLEEGWRLALQGRHPTAGSWTCQADLLWGLAAQHVTPAEIIAHLPAFEDWPADLRRCVQQPGPSGNPVRVSQVKVRVAEYLVRCLYPHDLDLHPFRVLLVAATGHAPEEISALTEDDVEFVPGGVRLTLVKRRAGLIRHRVFRDDKTSGTAEDLVAGTATGTIGEQQGRAGPRGDLGTLRRVSPTGRIGRSPRSCAA